MKKVVFAGLLCVLIIPCYARTITVNAIGTGDHPTIQAAIDDANDGDEIVLLSGTYTGNGNRDIDYLGKAVTVQSTDPNDPATVAATIIDCEGSEFEPHRGFEFNSGESFDSVLAGITITGGFGPEEAGYNKPNWLRISLGGAIFCRNSSPVIINCVLTNNTAGDVCTYLGILGFGGAIMCQNADPNIFGCTIADNFACYGAAIYGGGLGILDPNKSSPVISNCTITNNIADIGGGILGCNGLITNCHINYNQAELHGGGLALCDGTINGCTIKGNLGGSGGGISECGGTIVNCIIMENSTTDDPVGWGGGIYCHNAAPVIENCEIRDNSAMLGGGIAGSKGPISCCNITNNFATNGGGGLDSCSGPITDCHITNNTADSGGGLLYCSGTITNCKITNNIAGDESAFSLGLGGGLGWCNGDITNCIIKYNIAQRGGGGLALCNGTIENCQITDNSVLAEGFTMLDGSFGGGFYVCQGLIKNCVISNNSAGGEGGGLTDCNSITNCIISGNYAKFNGGGLAHCTRGLVDRCKISNNTAGEKGGALYWCNVTNSLISGNSATFGGAISNCEDVNNCTIVGNFADENGGAMYYVEPAPWAMVQNCILWDNVAGGIADEIYLANDEEFFMPSAMTINYCNIQDGTGETYTEPNCTLEWGSSNINTDPCFVDSGYWDPNDTPTDANDDFWVEGDYYLLADSPCINTGDPNYLYDPNETDLDGNKRLAEGRIDMGAYEYIPHIQAILNITPKRLNCSSKGKWLKMRITLPGEIEPEQLENPVPLHIDWPFPHACIPTYAPIVNRGKNPVTIELESDRQSILYALGCSHCEPDDIEYEIFVSGSLNDGRIFEAVDTITLLGCNSN